MKCYLEVIFKRNYLIHQRTIEMILLTNKMFFLKKKKKLIKCCHSCNFIVNCLRYLFCANNLNFSYLEIN